MYIEQGYTDLACIIPSKFINMPVVNREYKYIASTPQQLITKIANDDNIQWLNAYSSLTRESQLTWRPIFLKLLDTITGGDVISFINDILTPIDVATHIYPANEVYIHCLFTQAF